MLSKSRRISFKRLFAWTRNVIKFESKTSYLPYLSSNNLIPLESQISPFVSFSLKNNFQKLSILFFKFPKYENNWKQQNNYKYILPFALQVSSTGAIRSEEEDQDRTPSHPRILKARKRIRFLRKRSPRTRSLYSALGVSEKPPWSANLWPANV